jgi:hypothetical protein
MPDILTEPVRDRSAWMAGNLRQEDWLIQLTQAEIAALDDALTAVKAKGLAAETFGRDAFPLPGMADTLARLRDAVCDGPGFAVLRGLPAARYDTDDLLTLFWGFGMHFGRPVSQNSYGDVLGHVFDQGVKMGEGQVRGYQTSQNLRFHTDRADLTLLLCLRPAMRGGRSSVVSSIAIHNAILERHPDYLPPFYTGYPIVHVEEGGESETRRVPVFSLADGVLSCGIQRNTVETAIRKGALPVSAHERAALDCFDSLANDPDFRIDMDLQAGDIQLCNNYTVMHARTAYEDDPDPALKRRLARLWLGFDTPRPIAPHFADYNGIPKDLER